MPQEASSLRVKVIGVGGGGSNAVDRMIQAGVRGVEFIAANTDAQALTQSEAPIQIQLGPRTAKGLGVGGDPEWGARTAEESQAVIRDTLYGAQVVFIAAGMGGGTGTGAAPVVARIARELDALTIAAATHPFSFEGTRRCRVAKVGIRSLSTYANSLIVVPNDRLLPLVGRNVTFDVALRIADDVLRQGIQGISELITKPGLVNLDFASIRTALADAGGALMATGRGVGDGKAVQAAQAALDSPLLNFQLIDTAKTILVNITGGSDLTLHEVGQAARLISQACHPRAEILFGAIIDPEMDGEARVILVAGGVNAWEQETVMIPKHPKPSTSKPYRPIPVDWPISILSSSHLQEVGSPSGYPAAPVSIVANLSTAISPTGQAEQGTQLSERREYHRDYRDVPLPLPPNSATLHAANQSEQEKHSGMDYASISGVTPSLSQLHRPQLVQPSATADSPDSQQQEDREEERGAWESGNQNDERAKLRFLPNLDFPTFMRR